MINLINENILQEICFSCSLSEIKTTFDKLNNKVLNKILLKKLTHENIFKTIGKNKTILENHKHKITQLILLEDSLLSLSKGGEILFWDLNSHICYKSLLEPTVGLALILPNGCIATCSKYELCIRFDLSDFTCTKPINLKGYRYINNLILLSDRYLAVTAIYGAVCCYLIVLDYNDNFQRIKTIPLTSEIYSIINLSENRFATCSYPQKTIIIWSIDDDFKMLTHLSGHQKSVLSLLFIEKYHLLLSGSYDKDIKVWDTFSYECVSTIEDAHSGEVKCLVWLSCGYFASSSGNVIKIWDLIRFECINVLEGHNKIITSLVLLKDNGIASASHDKMIILWHY
jgi:WD40 repeat protein